MNFNKTTIALSALAASLISAQASAMMPLENPNAPKPIIKTKIYCLDSYGADGSITIYRASICDQSANNKKNKRPLNSNGCAEDQVALSETINVTAGEKFLVKIAACAIVDDSEVQPTQL